MFFTSHVDNAGDQGRQRRGECRRPAWRPRHSRPSPLPPLAPRSVRGIEEGFDFLVAISVFGFLFWLQFWILDFGFRVSVSVLLPGFPPITAAPINTSIARINSAGLSLVDTFFILTIGNYESTRVVSIPRFPSNGRIRDIYYTS